MHEYGNYMVQKLYKVSGTKHRLAILEIIKPYLSDLVKNKQGTHTIQAFISQFVTHEEYSLIAIELQNEYYELCRNNNGTHFVQKVIKTFPLQYTILFFNYTV